MKRFLAILILCFVVNYLKLTAADYIFNVGANHAAQGNATVMRYDLWSAFHNQAGLAHLQTINAGFYHESRFMMKEMGTQAFVFALPTTSGTFATSFADFGYKKYYEQKAGLAFAKSFGEKFSAGVQFDYFRTYIAEYDEKSNFTFELGIISEPVEHLFIAAHIFNPIRSSLNSEELNKIPVVFRVGAGYNVNDKAFISIETEKDMEKAASLKIGLEWNVIENLKLRGGIGTNPLNTSFGLGYRYKKLNIDMAFTYHPVLGATPHIGICYGL